MNPLDSDPSGADLSKFKDESVNVSETNKFKEIFGNCETIIIPNSSEHDGFTKKKSKEEEMEPEEIISQQENYLRVAKSINQFFTESHSENNERGGGGIQDYFNCSVSKDSNGHLGIVPKFELSKMDGASEVDTSTNILKTFIPASRKMTLKLDNLVDSNSFEKWPKTEKSNNEEKKQLQEKLIDLYVQTFNIVNKVKEQAYDESVVADLQMEFKNQDLSHETLIELIKSYLSDLKTMS